MDPDQTLCNDQQDQDDQIDNSSNILNEQYSKLKDPSTWEYEAPNYFDFCKMKSANNGNGNGLDDDDFDDQENDQYFLIDHEMDLKENNLIQDDSVSSIYQTPDKSNMSLDTNNKMETFFSAKKLISYALRDTPLREQYQNGQTPLKESRPSTLFNKRKSCHNNFRKSLHKSASKPITYNKSELISNVDDVDLNEDEINLKQIELALQFQKTLIVSNGEKKELETIVQKETKVIQKMETIVTIEPPEEFMSEDDDDSDNEQGNKVNGEIVNGGKINEDLVVAAKQTAAAAETEEETFHEISDLDLKPKEETTTTTTMETPINDEKSINNSFRPSYVVKSPIIISKKPSLSVRFGDQSPSDAATENNINDNNNGNETTPKNLEQKSKTSLKIQNRRGTPMIKSTKTMNKSQIQQRISMNEERLKRFQKYYKRFSRTPTTEEKSQPSNDDNVETKEQEEDGKMINQEEEEGNENKENVQQNEPTKATTAAANQLKKPTSVPSRKSINRLTFLRRSIKTCQPQKKFISLAEISQNFLRSARKYEPLTNQNLKKFGKLTKPHSPKLLTAQRSKCCRSKNNQEQQDQQDNGGHGVGPTTTSPILKKELAKNKIPLRPHQPPSTIVKQQTKRPQLTKAKTPQFCTDIRSKLYQVKHHAQQQEEEQKKQKSDFIFHAKPVPNFKKLQKLDEKKLREQCNNRHRLLQTKPFSFDQRIKKSTISTAKNN